MNYENKNTQKDSLAALRSETLGFSMMPMGLLPDLGLDCEPAQEIVATPRVSSEPKVDFGFSFTGWFRRRFRRLSKAIS